MGTVVTFQCDECGKSLATEGGLGIHMQTHDRTEPEPLEVIDVLEAVPVDAPRPPKPNAGPRLDLAALVGAPMLVTALAVAIVLMFLAGTTVAVRPSLIRNNKHETSAAAGSTSHSVPIPATPSTVAAPASSTTSTPPTTAAQPADSQKVQSLVLTANDFGPGWTVDTSDRFGLGALANSADSVGSGNDCPGAPSTPDPLTDTTGPIMAHGVLAAFTAGAVFASPDDAAANLAVLKDPRALACIRADFTQGVKDTGGAAVDAKTSVERFSLLTGTVSNGGLHFVATVTGARGSVSVYMDMLMLHAGRAASMLIILGAGSPVPVSIEQDLARRLAQKDLAQIS